MDWYERRDRLIQVAAIAPAYGTPRLDSDRHIGRVMMFKKYGFAAGFWPADHELLVKYIDPAFEKAQRLRTRALPPAPVTSYSIEPILAEFLPKES